MSQAPWRFVTQAHAARLLGVPVHTLVALSLKAPDQIRRVAVAGRRMPLYLYNEEDVRRIAVNRPAKEGIA